MKKSPKTRVLLLGVSSLCMLTIPQFAFANTTSSNTNNADLFPLTPRISGLGLAGTNEVIAGDAMAALAGNENGIWWLDGQGKTAFESAWVGSVGTGFRVVQDNKRILGAYLFGDRNISGNNTDFWFVSPGVESLGQVFDFRVNGYIPVSDQHKLTGTGFADTFGNYDYVTFQGHQQLDAIVDNYEMTGWGVDGEVGVKVPGWHGARVYVGGYHFDQDQADAINGVAARVEYPINQHLALNVRDSYDNTQHNTIEVGLQVNIGGVNKNPRERDQAIRERLLDPVSRNLATLGQGTAEPIGNEQVVVNNGNDPNPPLEVERDNIWFFSPTGTDTFSNNLEDCTAENVCVDTNFNQATVDGINAFKLSSPDINDNLSSSPSFYLASDGTYSALNGDGTGPMEFTNDFVWGVSPDFSQPDPTLLTGAMEFNGELNKINNIILQSDGVQQIGITLNTGSNLLMESSIVGTDSNSGNYFTGVQMSDSTLTATASEIHAFTDDPNIIATGINTNDTTTSIIDLSNNTLVRSTADLSAAPGANPYLVYGIRTDNVTGANIALDNSRIEVAVDTGTVVVPGTLDAEGIYVAHSLGTTANDSITLEGGSAVIVNATSKSVAPSNILIANGIDFATQNAMTNLTLNNSDVIATATGNVNTSTAAGVFIASPLNNNNTLNIENGSIITGDVEGVVAGTSTAAGVFMVGATDLVNIKGGSSINAINNAVVPVGALNPGLAQAFGLFIFNGNNVTINMNNGFINSTLNTTNASGFASGVSVGGTGAVGSTVNISVDGTSSILASSTTNTTNKDFAANSSNANGITVSSADAVNVNLSGTVTANATGNGVEGRVFSNGISVQSANTTTIALAGGDVFATSTSKATTGTIEDNAVGISIRSTANNAVNTITLNNQSNVTADVVAAGLSTGKALALSINDGIGTGVINNVTLNNSDLDATLNATTAINADPNFTDVADVQIIDSAGINTVRSTGSDLLATSTLGDAGTGSIEMETYNINILASQIVAASSAQNNVTISGGTLATKTLVTDGNAAELDITGENVSLYTDLGSNKTIIENSAALSDAVNIVTRSTTSNAVTLEGIDSVVANNVSGTNSVDFFSGSIVFDASIGGPLTGSDNLVMIGSYQEGGNRVTNNPIIPTYNFTPTDWDIVFQSNTISIP